MRKCHNLKLERLAPTFLSIIHHYFSWIKFPSAINHDEADDLLVKTVMPHAQAFAILEHCIPVNVNFLTLTLFKISAPLIRRPHVMTAQTKAIKIAWCTSSAGYLSTKTQRKKKNMATPKSADANKGDPNKVSFIISLMLLGLLKWPKYEANMISLSRF